MVVVVDGCTTAGLAVDADVAFAKCENYDDLDDDDNNKAARLAVTADEAVDYADYYSFGLLMIDTDAAATLLVAAADAETAAHHRQPWKRRKNLPFLLFSLSVHYHPCTSSSFLLRLP